MKFHLRNRWTKWFLMLAMAAPIFILAVYAFFLAAGCEGGFMKDRARCNFVSNDLGQYAFNTMFLGALFSVFWSSACLVLGLFAEIWARYFRR